MRASASSISEHAPPFVTVCLEAALVRDLRRAMNMVGDPFDVPPRTPEERRLQQAGRNWLAVDAAVRAYLRPDAAYRAELERGA
jgi:hypothetical protein